MRFGTARPTVILLHSSASSARQWDALIRALEPRFRVLAVDFHGHGAKPGWTSDRPLRLADEAALVEPLLAAGGVHVVGHSYGAAVALKVATLHPHALRSVVAFEPVLFPLLIESGRHEQAQIVATVADDIHRMINRGQRVAAAERFIGYWSGAATWTAMASERQQAIATRMPAVGRHFDALFREPALCRQASQLDVPMLFLSGTDTVPAMRQVMELVRKAQPRASHRVIDGAAHMGPITHAAEINALVADFLDERVTAADGESRRDDAVVAMHRPGLVLAG
jgi:pimeloyl-ACP methyl ester carboxylesterase